MEGKGGAQREPWTLAEKALLAEGWNRGDGRFKIAKRLGRSPGSISGKVREMKLGPSLSRLRRPWNEAELADLRRLWPAGQRNEIEAAIPRRQWYCITKMATVLKIKRVRQRVKGRGAAIFSQLRAEREKQRLTRLALAQKIGTHAQCLLRWELGRRSPHFHLFDAWVNALGFEVVLKRKEVQRFSMIGGSL